MPSFNVRTSVAAKARGLLKCGTSPRAQVWNWDEDEDEEDREILLMPGEHQCRCLRYEHPYMEYHQCECGKLW